MLFQIRWVLLFFSFISTLASAQVVDNFSDGNFTVNPIWAGDSSQFIVNTAFQLQTNNTIAGASYLSTPSYTTSLNNTEWSFYIKQSFAPSSSNYGRVYLSSNQTNLEGSLNGYYLQFGETLSNDAVELFRQTGTTSTSVCRGVNGQIAASFAISVRVIRDAIGVWKLYVDPTGGISYVMEAAGTDNTYTTSNYFGVATVYTSSNGQNFYFDNFYNGPIVIDITPPAIVSSTIISSTQLDVLFSEAVDTTTAQTLTNYSADNGLGNPAIAIRDAVNFSLVHLTFATSFTNGLLNTLTVSNIQDLSANVMLTTTANFTYIVAPTAAYKDIIINEIMADPTPQVNCPAVEFIELYNRSTNNYNLYGWKFTDNVSTATLGNVTLSANQYLIICNTSDTALFIGYGNYMGVSSFPSLNNSGDHLYIKDNTLAYIDSVIYSDTWYQDAVKKNGGWTLELINPNASGNCPVSSNWIASTNINGGTPGFQNSVYSILADITHPIITGISIMDSTHIYICFSKPIDAASISIASNYTINRGIGAAIADTVNSTFTCVYLTLSYSLINSSTYIITLTNITDCLGNSLLIDTASVSFYKVKPFDVVINEIMADPDPPVNILPNDEYVEMYNRTLFPINLNNWTFTSGTTTRTIINATIAPHGYMVLTTPAAVPFFFSNININGIISFPTLNNTGQTLILKSAEGAIISTVSYTDNWYQNTYKKNGGWSLEQIDPNNPCAGLSNWRASESAAGGTPGTINSINAVNSDNTPPQILRASVISSDSILLFFNEPIDSTTMLNPIIYSINNGIGNPIIVKPIAPDFSNILLALATSLQAGIIYSISVNNTITDCIGNSLGLDNTARFALPVQAKPNDIVINEILADPNVGGVDYVEIYNRSQKVIDLKTIILSEFDTVNNIITSPKVITSQGYLIFPADYLLLSANGNSVKNQYNTTNPKGFIDLTSMISMNIASGTVCLSTATDIIDNFTYNADMQFALLNVTKGVSLERIDFNRISQDRTNWHSAAQDIGFGTPSCKNSQYNYAGETDNAIEINPEIFSPDDDGYNDIVNINYHFDTPGFVANINIYDSKGGLIKHLIQNELLGIKGTFSWDGINEEREKSRIGIYIIYFEVFDLSGTVKHYKKTCVLGGKLR